MHDHQNTAMAELAFKLGRITRQAIFQATGVLQPADLSKIAAEVLEELGDTKVDPDVLMMFVAGFHETDPRPERRAAHLAGGERED